MIRIPGICNHDPETVVLAHLNGGGMGMKAHDLLGAWACSACHSYLDGGHKDDPRLVELAHYHGVRRTIEQLAKEGKV